MGTGVLNGSVSPFAADLWRRRQTPFQPVVSVGNIAMGGRGKTPLVALVARMLLAAGERPAILTRGYGRRRPEDGVVVVSDGAVVLSDVDHGGDEPVMLAESLHGVRVLVCETRAMAAAVAERALGATVHVLDDGFQHRAMPRDVDIVIVAPADMQGRRLPFGRLRESPRAIGRAGAVIVDSGDHPRGAIALGHASQRQFDLRRKTGDPTPVGSARPLDRAQPVVAVAGIAAPDRFRLALESAGWRVARFLPFSDHHVFSSRDVAAVARAVRETGAAAVVTTAKDAVRLRVAGEIGAPLAVAPLDVELDVLDSGASFHDWLLECVGVAHAARSGEAPW
jgi:tetraacyldisaccharide 4'-kinase